VEAAASAPSLPLIDATDDSADLIKLEEENKQLRKELSEKLHSRKCGFAQAPRQGLNSGSERRHASLCCGAVDLSYDCAWINAVPVTRNDCGKVPAAML
jgi:hypothetical protein